MPYWKQYCASWRSSVLTLFAATLVSACSPSAAVWQKPGPSEKLESFALLISFGHGEPAHERWHGTLSIEDGVVEQVKGWRIREHDRISLDGFDVRTARSRPGGHGEGRSEPKGVRLLGQAGSGAGLSVSTNHGDFSFALSDLSADTELRFLENRVRVAGANSIDKLTDDFRDDDYPSIALADDNTAWAVWQSYSGRSDEIRLSKYDGHDSAWRTFTRVPGVSGDVWRPQLALDGRGLLWVVWSQQLDGNFDLYARALDEAQNQWLDLVRLSNHPNPDFDHHLVTDSQGGLWVVWQGFHGDNSDIFLRHYDGSANSTWGRQIQITDHPANDWEPRLAVDSGGRAHIVWDTYRNGNYDVFMRRYSDGQLGAETPVADTPKFEAHASVAIDKSDRVWVAWDEAPANWAKDTGLTVDPEWLEKGEEAWDVWLNNLASPGSRIYTARQINLAIFEGGQKKAPAEGIQAALSRQEISDQDYPQLVADPGTGRMGLLFHRWDRFFKRASVGLRPTFWQHAVIFYDGDRWSQVYTMPESMGRPSMRSDAAFSPSGTLWTVWPTDGRFEGRSIEDLVGNVYCGRIEPDGAGTEPVVTAWQDSKAEPVSPVHPNEAAEVAAIRKYRTRIDGAENRIVRGDLHRHTEFSWDSGGGNVDGSAFDFYRYMMDAAAMDFGGITDHNSGGDYEYGWWLIEKTCDLYHVPRAFTTLYGYERSVSYPFGHRNIFHVTRGNPVVSFFTRPSIDEGRPRIAADDALQLSDDTRLLHEALRESGGISIPHTTGSNMGTDWADNDPEVEPVVEIFQGDRVNYETPGAPRAPRGPEDKPVGGYEEAGFVWNAYRKGYRIGTTASSDHWSTHISYTMVFTEQPTREAIFEAIKRRHTYGATDNIILDYRMGSHFMGDEFTASAAPLLKIRIQGTDAVAKIEVIKNEQVVYTATPNQKDVSLTYRDEGGLDRDSYYYVRIVQKDREVAWGSPIWVNLR